MTQFVTSLQSAVTWRAGHQSQGRAKPHPRLRRRLTGPQGSDLRNWVRSAAAAATSILPSRHPRPTRRPGSNDPRRRSSTNVGLLLVADGRSSFAYDRRRWGLFQSAAVVRRLRRGTRSARWRGGGRNDGTDDLRRTTISGCLLRRRLRVLSHATTSSSASSSSLSADAAPAAAAAADVRRQRWRQWRPRSRQRRRSAGRRYSAGCVSVERRRRRHGDVRNVEERRGEAVDRQSLRTDVRTAHELMQ